jgi:CRISPR/Cas system-associated exonuclease Cas4 (RecB family)
MFEVAVSWNQIRPDTDLDKQVIMLRGYSNATFLTGQFASGIKDKKVRRLSNSDISDFLCPTRRDLYIKKGQTRPRLSSRETWGRTAGDLVHEFSYELLRTVKQPSTNYPRLRRRADNFVSTFKGNWTEEFEKLGNLKGRKDEDPEWFLRLLSFFARGALSSSTAQKTLWRDGDLEPGDIRAGDVKLYPDILQVGINPPATPDFLIEKYRTIGDIKSGIGGFKDYFLLTCTGYALAYENEKGPGHDIDHGMILFFPSRQSEYSKAVSFAQVYLFSIDDSLRRWYIQIRNEAYDIASKNAEPVFPRDTSHCPRCQYLTYCLSQGLQP